VCREANELQLERLWRRRAQQKCSHLEETKYTWSPGFPKLEVKRPTGLLLACACLLTYETFWHVGLLRARNYYNIRRRCRERFCDFCCGYRSVHIALNELNWSGLDMVRCPVQFSGGISSSTLGRGSERAGVSEGDWSPEKFFLSCSNFKYAAFHTKPTMLIAKFSSQMSHYTRQQFRLGERALEGQPECQTSDWGRCVSWPSRITVPDLVQFSWCDVCEHADDWLTDYIFTYLLSLLLFAVV